MAVPCQWFGNNILLNNMHTLKFSFWVYLVTRKLYHDILIYGETPTKIDKDTHMYIHYIETSDTNSSQDTYGFVFSYFLTFDIIWYTYFLRHNVF
jgi:hypothetical protein